MRLKRTYNLVAAKFLARRDRIQRAVNNLRERGKWTAHKKLNDMLQAADALKLELGQKLAEEHAHDKRMLKTKLKQFNTYYKTLNQDTKPHWQQWVEAIVSAGLVCLVVRNFLFSIYHVPTGSAEPTILVGDRLWGNKTAYFFEDIKRGDMVIFDDPRQGYDESSWFTYYWQKYVGLPIPFLVGPGPINVVKRVIAVPGDTIEGRVEDGKTVIYRNGEKLDEPYVNPHPLIVLYKSKGFLPQGFAPSFLTYERYPVSYTYDQSKPYDQQPYYYINERDVIKHPHTGKPILRESHTPDYARDGHCIDEFGPIKLPKDKYWVMGDSRKNSDDSRGWYFLDKKYIHGRASFIIYSLDSEEAWFGFELLKHPIDFWTKYLRWDRTFRVLK